MGFVLQGQMRKVIRKNDIWRLSPLAVAAQKVPATLVTTNEGYLQAVATMPDWFFPASVGFAIAVWLVDPWTDDSRLLQFWHWLVDSFIVESLHAGGVDRSDLSITVWLKFRRRVRRGKLWLRVYGCTHMGRKPQENLLLIEELVDVPRGFKKRVEIGSFAFPVEGWDHTKKRGWAGGQQPLVGKSSNVVVLELHGMLFIQRYRVFVEQIDHVGNEFRPSLFVLGEDNDVFDPFEDCPSRSALRA